MGLIEENLERLQSMQRDLAEISVQFRNLLQPYIEGAGLENLADTTNMSTDELREIADFGAYGVPVAKLVLLAWALDTELRFDFVPHRVPH